MRLANCAKFLCRSMSIEPPDVLLIETVNNIRPASAPVHVGEALLVQVNRTIPLSQMEEICVGAVQDHQRSVHDRIGWISESGPRVRQGTGRRSAAGSHSAASRSHLRHVLTNPQVLVTLPAPQNKQFVAGPHLVRPDGTVGLGVYGSVYVTGLTLQQARTQIEQHLSQYIYRPEVSLDVLAYNSKVYYVITDGGGAGEQVYRIPSTGNETVLDAIAGINGLPAVASKGSIWIARPSPNQCTPDQVLTMDWNAIAQGGSDRNKLSGAAW